MRLLLRSVVRTGGLQGKHGLAWPGTGRSTSVRAAYKLWRLRLSYLNYISEHIVEFEIAFGDERND